MKFVRFAALLLAAALSWTARAHAQTDTAAVSRALASVCPGAEVRLALASADPVRGDCGWVEDGRLLVRRGMDERQVAVAQIDSVWVRAQGVTGAARTGGIIGALAVGGAFMFVSNGLCDAASGCGTDTAAVGALGAFLGYLTGSFIGALLGGATNGWDRRYP